MKDRVVLFKSRRSYCKMKNVSLKYHSMHLEVLADIENIHASLILLILF